MEKSMRTEELLSEGHVLVLVVFQVKGKVGLVGVEDRDGRGVSGHVYRGVYR